MATMAEMIAEATKKKEEKKSYFTQYREAIFDSGASADSKIDAVGKGLLTSIGKPIKDFIWEPVKTQIDKVRLWAQDFEEWIKQFSQIKTLQEKPYVEITEDENKVLSEFYEKSKQKGFSISDITDEKQATILWIKTKQEQYDRYKSDIMWSNDKTNANFAGQAFANVIDKVTTWRRDGDENIAERITLWLAGWINTTKDIVVDNFEPLDEDERMYAIWNNSALSNSEKIISQAESFYKNINIDIKFDSQAYESSREKLLEEASNKIWSGLSWENDSSTFARTWKVMAWYTSFFFAPILPLFEENVTGATTESAWALLATPFTLLMNSSSESLQALWTDKETADNWAEVIAITGPLVVRAGKKPKDMAREVSAETSMIAWLPKQYQSLYVNTRGKVWEIQALEKIPSRNTIAQRKVLWENTWVYRSVPGRNTWVSQIRNLWEKFVIAMRDGKFADATQISKQIDGLFTTLKAAEKSAPTYLQMKKSRLWFLDPAVLVKNINRLDIWNKINKNSLNNLIKEWDTKSLMNIRKEAAALSVGKNTKNMDISTREKDIITENLFEALQEKKSGIEKSMQDLYTYQQNKKNAKEVVEEMKSVSPEEANIAKQELDTKYKDTPADPAKWIKQNRTKYDLLKSLVENWILKVNRKNDTNGWVNRTYSVTESGNWVLPKNKLGIVEDLFHYPDKLAKVFEAADNIKKNIEQDVIQMFETREPKGYKTQLEKNIIKKWITPEKYIENSLQNTLRKKGQIERISMEIENSRNGEQIVIEWDIGSSTDVVASSSTFPKWIPSNLRDKKLMQLVWDKLLKWDINIPEQNVRQRNMMEVFLSELRSPLKDIYQVDLKNIWNGNRKLQWYKEKVLQSKQFAKAYYQEYKKRTREVDRLEKKIQSLWENAAEQKAILREKITDLKDTYKNRKAVVNAIRSEYRLSDKEFNTLSKTKDYLKFRDEYAFKEFALKLEMNAYELYALKIERADIQRKILEKELVNIENVFKAYDLPNAIEKFNEKDIQVLEWIIDHFEKGDVFIGSTLQKRFQVVENGKWISTVREAIETMFEDIPWLQEYAVSAKEATARIYQWALSDLKQQISDYQAKIKDAEDPTQMQAALEELRIEEKSLQKEYDAFTRSQIKDINFKNNADKTKNEKVTEQKIVRWEWTDRFLFDSAMTNKDPYFKFLVRSYIAQRTKYDKKKLEVEDTLRPLLNESRKSVSRGVKDRLIPTDDIVIKYLESPAEIKTEMILDGQLTKENLELAHYVQQLFMEYRNELAKRRVIDKFLNEYVTHMNQWVSQVFKYKWIQAAVKQIFTKEDHVFDFWALGDRDQVLGYEKFFRFWIERKWMKDYNMDLGQIVMGYTNTFYKKLTLDEVIPKAVLYRDILADSSAAKTITAWINNKKWIRSDDLQGTWLDKTFTAFKTFVALKDLWFNAVTAGASTLWVSGANYALLGWVGWAKGITRKNTSQWRSILKAYEWTFWKNPLWNIWEDLLKSPDITPLQMPIQLAFTMLGQVFKSWMNTAFLWKLTPEEFKTGNITDERMADIIIDIGKYHSLPGTQSIWWSTLIWTGIMQYKTWAAPLLYTNIRLTKRISSWQSLKDGTFKKDAADLYRSMIIPVALAITMMELISDEETYLMKRLRQELTSAVWAMNPALWLSLPRTIGYFSSILWAMWELFYDADEWEFGPARYKASKEWQYQEWDLKGINHIMDQFDPGFMKQFDIFREQLESWKTEKKSNTWWSRLDRISDRLERLDRVGTDDRLDRISDRLDRIK